MMDPGEDRALGAKLDALSRELKALGERVARLERFLPASAAAGVSDFAPLVLSEPGRARGETSSGWRAATTVLSRAATACFLLVFALILRTLTDNGLMAPAAGSAVGIAYSLLLVCASWFLYGRRSASAPVFAVSGALLLCAVTLEAHRHFRVMSSPSGFVLLFLMGCVTTFIGRRFAAAAPASAGVTGMVLSGAALDLSAPACPGLGALLLGACALAHGDPGRRSRSWVRGFVLAASAAFWLFWALSLNAALAEPSAAHGEWLGLSWFSPLLAATALLHWATAYRGSVARSPRGPGFLDSAIPTLTAVWGYGAASLVLTPWQRSPDGLGLAASLSAAILFGLAWRVSREAGGGARGTASFSFAACLLLALGLPLGGEKGLYLLPLVSAAAFALSMLSTAWASGGSRLVSYLLQVFVCVFALAAGTFSVSDAPWPFRGGAAAALASVSFLHYRWCRGHPPSAEAGFFGRLDRTDDTAVALLLTSLVAAFLACRVALYEVIATAAADPANVYQCAQSVLINLSALALVSAAFYRRNSELRAVAVLVILAGALKVFFLDLLAAYGLPLVASVFSFGLAAAAGALVLRRWQASGAGSVFRQQAGETGPLPVEPPPA